MPYTPVELRHVNVSRALLGYKRTAVQDLLNEIADSFETVWRERHELADQLETMEKQLADLRLREEALTQTLVAAERAATHVKDQAKSEAELIIAQAHAEARGVTLKAQSDRHRLLGDTHRIESLLRAALAMFEETDGGDEVVEEPAEPDESAQPQLRKVSGGFDWVD